MATTSSAAVQIERAHQEALEVLREHDSPETTESVEYLDNLGGHLASVNFPAQLSSAQLVLIGGLAAIVREQGRRIAKLEEAAAAKSPARKSRKD